MYRFYVKLGQISGLKLKSGPQLETIRFLQTPSPSQALLARPYFLPITKVKIDFCFSNFRKLVLYDSYVFTAVKH